MTSEYFRRSLGDLLVLNERTANYTRLWNEHYSSEKFGIFLLGAGVMQVPVLLLARKMGIRVWACDGNSHAVGAELAHEFLHIDLKDQVRIGEHVRLLAQAGEVHAVLTAGTDFSSQVAFAAEKAGLPGIPYQRALDASRKQRMRALFHDAGLPGPKYFFCGPQDNSTDRLRQSDLSLPVVVKPVDNMGARGVSLVNRREELQAAVDLALGYSREATVIVEEKIVGPEYSLDSLISDGTMYPMGIARRRIDYPPYFVERGHDFPSDLHAEQQEHMFSILASAAKALEIHNGALKGDIFFTDKGPVIGEVAARLSGGYMSGWTFPLHSGCHPSIGAIQLALGQPLVQDFMPDYFTNLDNRPVSERGIISIPGILEEMTLSVEAKAQYTYIFPAVEPGENLVFPRNNVEKCGSVILADEKTALEEHMSHVLLHLTPLSPTHFAEMLLGEFPLAYPDAYWQYFPDGRKSCINLLRRAEQPCKHSIIVPVAWQEYGSEAVGRHRHAFDESSPKLGQALMHKDWAYRTMFQSLNQLQEMAPELRLQFGDTTENGAYGQLLLYSLLRGGLQAASYCLELGKKFTEKQIVTAIKDVFGE